MPRPRVLTPRRVAVTRHRAVTTRLRLAAAIPLHQVAVATQHRAIAPAAVEAPIMVVEEAVPLMAVEVVAEVRRTRATKSRFVRV